MASFINVFRSSLGPNSRHRPVTVASFLVPSLSSLPPTSKFSTSSSDQSQSRRDNSKNRGVSAVRRTGLNKRQVLTVDPAKLPQPVLDPAQRSRVQVDPDHGLWEFFNPDRTPFATPEYNTAFGRAWTVAELRRKHWEELWCLWWVCVKERNRLSTEEYERQRVNDNTNGAYEAEERDSTVRETMKGIKFVLTERWYAWEDARKLAKKNPDIDLNASPQAQKGAAMRGQKGAKGEVLDQKAALFEEPDTAPVTSPQSTTAA